MPKNFQLNVLSYNIQMRPDIPLFVDGKDHETRASLIAQKLKNYSADVLVFQEAFVGKSRRKLVTLLKPAYPYATKVLGREVGLNWDGGVIIVSRWPILAQKETIFRAKSGFDGHAQKGVKYAAIKKQGVVCHIFGTHLQAGGNNGHIREQQMQQARNFITGMGLPPEEPVVLAGDMNIDYNPYSVPYQRMLDILDISMPNRQGHPYTSDPNNDLTDDKKKKPKYLDYVFPLNDTLLTTSSHLKTEIFRTTQPWKKHYRDLSDHYAVLGKFTYKVPVRHDSPLFVGTWKRVLFNRNHEADGPIVQFRKGRIFYAEYPGRAHLKGRIYNIEVHDNGRGGKLKVWVENTQKFQTWHYTFNHNNGFEDLIIPGINPLPHERKAPQWNELRLFNPGVDQLYAFVYHHRQNDRKFPPPIVEAADLKP